MARIRRCGVAATAAAAAVAWFRGPRCLLSPLAASAPPRPAACHPSRVRPGSARTGSVAVAAQEGPWLQTIDVAREYPEQALNADLFDPRSVDTWLEPSFLEAIQGWRKSGDARQIDLDALKDACVEAPGIISFALLREETCRKLLAEVRHYTESSGFPRLAPNSMNRDGVVLNEIGLRPSFTALFRRCLAGVAARLFGEDGVRAEGVGGVPVETENWGGSALSDHHTFVVRYTPDRDRRLDMHVDDSEVTFNVGLTDGEEFCGGDLAFCGVFGESGYRRHHVTYRHRVGRCVVHLGKRRHSVVDVEDGERASLVMWAKSILFRQTKEYKDSVGKYRMGFPLPSEGEPPDPICLSLAHDKDYLRWSHLL